MSTPSHALPGDEIDLQEIWNILWRHRGVVLVTAVLPVVLAFALAYSQPKVYISEAIILPTPRNIDGNELLAASVAAQNSPLTATLAGFTTAKSPDLMGLLNSRTIAERVATKYQLANAFGAMAGDALAAQVREGVSILPPSQTKAVTIHVEGPKPELTATIANGYVEQLQASLDEMAHAKTAKKLALIEQQLATVKREMASNPAEAAGGHEARKQIYMALVQQHAATLIEAKSASEEFLLLDKAKAPEAPVGAKVSHFLLIGILIGATSGILAAFITNRLSVAKQ